MSKILGENYNYINEGNVHIVIQLHKTEFVLRLIKDDKNTITLDTINKAVNFVNLIMIPLLSPASDYLQEVITIPESEITELSKALHPLRPEFRRFKSKLSQFAIKTHNLAMFSPKCSINYCIEIKPKEGFIAANLAITNKCFYCLKQSIKLQNDEIVKRTQYCPLDLFSGDRKRIKKALNNLIDNPQNNFNIFKNCQVVYNKNSNKSDFVQIVKDMDIFGSPDLFIDFITEVLLSNDHQKNDLIVEQTKDRSNLRTKSLTKQENIQTQSQPTFLNNLLQIQKVSDKLTLDLSKAPENTEYLEPLLQHVASENLNLNLSKDRDVFLITADPFHLSLIAAVAKDCSIMISFPSENIQGFPSIKIGDKNVPYRLSVTDLEPKNAKTLLKRKVTEKQMLDMYYDIQPNTETRAKQLEAWEQLISDYMKTNKLSTIDIRETLNSPLFNNTSINRKLSQEAVLTILEDMAKNGKAAPVDKSKMVWEVYWHSLDEWGNMIYNWACNNGMNNSVCTLFELREGENTDDQEFHGLDMNVLLKALKSLEAKGRCELMEFDDNQGVKFF